MDRDALVQAVRSGGTRLRSVTNGPLRVAGMAAAGLSALAAAVAARRRLADRVTLPDPGPLAADAAISVHNAAKAAMISAVREADDPDEQLIVETVEAALREGEQSGVDLTAIALGVVGGAAEVAHLIGLSQSGAAALAGQAATNAAATTGLPASTRVQDALESCLPGR